jgi:hypothetical protein
MNVFLVSGHMRVDNKKKIPFTNPTTSILNYGKVGDLNNIHEFQPLEDEFFRNNLPTDNVVHLTERANELRTHPNKQYKLNQDTYHDSDMNLCAIFYIQAQKVGKHIVENIVEDIKDATSVDIEVSGVYIMNTDNFPLDFKRINIQPEYNDDFTQTFFYITLTEAHKLYYGALYPTPAVIDRIFSGKRKMLVNEFESHMNVKLSFIINKLQTNNCVFIVDGCRYFRGHPRELTKRRVSSGSAEEIVVAPTHKRSSGKKGDSLMDLMGLGIKTRKMKRKRIKRRR